MDFRDINNFVPETSVISQKKLQILQLNLKFIRTG